ncbi:MAG: GH19, partial [uncultured Gemmatimonadetes bacterium]
ALRSILLPRPLRPAVRRPERGPGRGHRRAAQGRGGRRRRHGHPLAGVHDGHGEARVRGHLAAHRGVRARQGDEVRQARDGDRRHGEELHQRVLRPRLRAAHLGGQLPRDGQGAGQPPPVRSLARAGPRGGVPDHVAGDAQGLVHRAQAGRLHPRRRLRLRERPQDHQRSGPGAAHRRLRGEAGDDPARQRRRGDPGAPGAGAGYRGRERL